MRMCPLHLLFFLSASLLISGFGIASYKTIEQKNWQSEFNATLVKPPASLPTKDNRSIQLAMLLFGIEKPKDVADPIFESKTEDRGYTVRYKSFGNAYVRVGEEAFKSWAILGSTLAHEIEVHGNQSFFWIKAFDVMGFEATAYAEHAAYMHEIKHAQRFGLTQVDTRAIKNTLDYYFPIANTTREIAIRGPKDLTAKSSDYPLDPQESPEDKPKDALQVGYYRFIKMFANF